MPKPNWNPPHRIAKRVMGPHEQCWCGSEDLWTICHKGRARERPVSMRESSARLNPAQRNGYCSHPDAPSACRGRAIRAHSLQKATALRSIAEDGHVYSVRGGIGDDGRREIKAVGIQSASTFFGFCNHHDNTMFKPIESGAFPLDRRATFLISFRSVAMEVLTRQDSIRALRRARIDAGRSLAEQENIVNRIERDLLPIINGQRDFVQWKERLDKIYRTGDYEQLNMVIVEFEGSIPLISSSEILPWFNFEGDLIQDLIELDEPDQMAFALTYIGNRSALICCWEGDEHSAARQLLNSYLKQPDNLKATAAALMALGYAENTYMRKSWWDSLYPRQQERVREIMDFGTGGPEDHGIRSEIMNTALAPFKIDTAVKEIRWL
jgi:hypothetical protein